MNQSKSNLKKLSFNNDFNIKIGVSENINSDEEILDILLKDICNIVRFYAAKNSNLSKNKLKKISNYQDHNVKRGVANNLNSDEKILESLLVCYKINDFSFYDTSEYVRRDAAKNPNLSKNKLKELAYSKDEFIKLGVALNKNSDEEILDILFEDYSYIIRNKAAQNTNLSQNKIKQLLLINDTEIKIGLAINPILDEESLIFLFKEFPEYVLINPNCPDYLKVLLK